MSEALRDAVAECTRVSVARVIRNTQPLAYHDEYQAADDAAAEVSA